MNKYRSILVLAALEQEENALVECLKSSASVPKFFQTQLHPQLELQMTTAQSAHRTVSIVRTGIASVNAAISMVLALESQKSQSMPASHPFDAVVLLGVGGALQKNLNVGDLVISRSVIQHDYFYSFEGHDQRIQPGALILSSEEARGHVAEMNADPELVTWMSSIQDHPRFQGRVFEGTVLSGNEFVGRVERKEAIAKLSNAALLVDMEAAGVAQVATKLQIPFVVMKTVADRLSPDGSIESDFRATLSAASNHAALALQLLIEA